MTNVVSDKVQQLDDALRRNVDDGLITLQREDEWLTEKRRKIFDALAVIAGGDTAKAIENIAEELPRPNEKNFHDFEFKICSSLVGNFTIKVETFNDEIRAWHFIGNVGEPQVFSNKESFDKAVARMHLLTAAKSK